MLYSLLQKKNKKQEDKKKASGRGVRLNLKKHIFDNSDVQ